MRKRILNMLLGLSMLLTVLPVTAAAGTAEPGETPAVPVEQVTDDVHTSIVLPESVPEELPTMAQALASTRSQTLGTSNQDVIFAYLTGVMGLNSAGAAGIVANIYFESGFQSDIYGDAGTSYGICQWHNGRFANLRNWCADHGYDYTTLDGQLHFLHYELQTSYSNVWNCVNSVPDTAEGAYHAAYYWCKYFEVPADTENRAQQRGKYAVDTMWPQYAGQSQNVSLAARTDAGAYVLDSEVTLRAETTGDFENLSVCVRRLNEENEWETYLGSACPDGEVTLTVSGAGVYTAWFTADFEGQTLESNTVQFLVAEHLWDMTLLKPSNRLTNGVVYCRCSHCGMEEIRDVYDPDHDLAPCPGERFQDVDADAWYHSGVDYVLANYLYSGSSLTEFKPEEEMSRAALLQMLWRMSGSPYVVAERVFADIPDDAGYAPAVDWAVANGIAEGLDEERFGPDEILTRADAAVLLYNYALHCGTLQYAAADLAVYPDADSVSESAFSAVQWAVSTEIFCDTDGLELTELRPDAPLTRAQAAVWCRNLADVLAEVN